MNLFWNNMVSLLYMNEWLQDKCPGALWKPLSYFCVFILKACYFPASGKTLKQIVVILEETLPVQS
jgi:hypothetical protein